MGANVIGGDTDSLFVYFDDDIQKLLNKIHSYLPIGIRFKLEYTAKKFIITTKKRYICMIEDDKQKGKYRTKITGYKAIKSSSCKAVHKCFKKAIEILLSKGPIESYAHYCNKLRKYNDVSNVRLEEFAYRFNYKGKDYKEGTSRRITVDSMKARGVEIIAGNSLDVTIVHSYESFCSKYGRNPPITLPLINTKCFKSKRLYTVEEVGKNIEIVDTEAVLDLQCWSDLQSILSCYDCNV